MHANTINIDKINNHFYIIFRMDFLKGFKRRISFAQNSTKQN